MSQRARAVLHTIDVALTTLDRNPSLFSRLLYKNLSRPADCQQLARAVDRHKNEKPNPASRPDRDEVERVDRTWEEQEARRREERWQKRQPQLRAERRDARRDLTPVQLHHWVINEAERMSAAGAGNVAPSRGGTPDAPTAPQMLADDPRWIESWTVIRRRLEQAAELIDDLKGYGAVATTTTMLAEEKDRMILSRENEGLGCQAVVDKLGSFITGSERNVRRIRHNAGLDSRGLPRQVSH